MLSYCTNYWDVMPSITVFMNCDTRLAINLSLFNLGDQDEFIFTIKNYGYIDSPYVFLFRAKKADMDENGEVIFKITPAASKQLKPGAFYNFAVLLNAFDTKKETEYKKLTDNGQILIDYGAHDLTVAQETEQMSYEIVGVRLEHLDKSLTPDFDKTLGDVLGMRLEPLAEE